MTDAEVLTQLYSLLTGRPILKDDETDLQDEIDLRICLSTCHYYDTYLATRLFQATVTALFGTQSA